MAGGKSADLSAGKNADLSVAHFPANHEWPFRSAMAFMWAGCAALRVFQMSIGSQTATQRYHPFSRKSRDERVQIPVSGVIGAGRAGRISLNSALHGRSKSEGCGQRSESARVDGWSKKGFGFRVRKDRARPDTLIRDQLSDDQYMEALL